MGILPKGLAIGSTAYSCTFSRKPIVMDPFMYQKKASMTFFTD